MIAGVLRVAIMGIDGCGKTTTAVKLVERLAGKLSICKPGRPPLVAVDGVVQPFLAEESRALEQHLRKADATGRRWPVVLSRRRYLGFVTRAERVMAARFSPRLMLLARCALVDPAVYAEFYLPRLSGLLSLPARLRLVELVSRVPPRQLYFHLDTPVEVALERIHGRVAALNQQSQQGTGDGREHWLHLHERAEVLSALSWTLREALELVSRRTGARVVRVDNSQMRQDGVVELMAERILALERGADPSPASPRQQAPAAPGLSLTRAGPQGARRATLPHSGSPQRDRAALVQAGEAGILAFPGGEQPTFLVLEPGAGRLAGPYPLDEAPVRSLSPLAQPPGSALPRDVFVVHEALASEGAEVRLTRLDGSGAAKRWTGPRPGLLARATLLRGNSPAGAWGQDAGGRNQALIAYHEPSRTQLWGLALDDQAGISVRPFALASVDEDMLLCGSDGRGDVRVASTGQPGRFTVVYASYRTDSDEPAQYQRLEVNLSGDNASAEAPRKVPAPPQPARPPWLPEPCAVLALTRHEGRTLCLAREAEGQEVRLWVMDDGGKSPGDPTHS